MFSAIAYQLVYVILSNTLRQTVADQLGANRASHCDFVCQPVAQNEDYNADTEPQTHDDDSTEDPELLIWQKCLKCLKKVPISDMLGVTINVLSSHYPMYSVTPRNHCADNEVLVGLIMQYHYVGLDKMPEQPQHTIPVQPAQPETIANSDAVPEQPECVYDNELDDATIE